MHKIIYTNSWKTGIAREIFPDVELINPLLERDRFNEALPDAVAVIGAGFRVDERFLALGRNLKIVALTSVGFDQCDVPLMNKRGVLLANTPDILTETTADLAFALLMATARRLTEASEMIKRGDWKTSIGEELFGMDIHGKRLGVIGLGRIGEAIARRGHFGFGMPISYYNRQEKKDLSFKADYRSLEELLKESDYVMISAPLTEETKGLIGDRELRLMKKEAILINIARGPLVDEAALVEALKSKRIRAAGLDVFNKEPIPLDSPFLGLANAVLIPHLGSATDRCREDMVKLAAGNVRDFLEQREPQTLVNRELFQK
jgi:phosphogluconate 2-dehydrogenase